MSDHRELISVLLDPEARIAERDDAAMDLHAYDSPEAEEALLLVARDESVPELIRASAGESLGELWIRRGLSRSDILSTLTAVARLEAEEILRSRQVED